LNLCSCWRVLALRCDHLLHCMYLCVFCVCLDWFCGLRVEIDECARVCVCLLSQHQLVFAMGGST
jgi:hypothetical protein